jgi:hypothetical protein
MSNLINNILFLFYFFGVIVFGHNIYQNYLILTNLHEDFLNNNNIKQDDIKEDNNIEETKKKIKSTIPYEEKYLLQIRNMINEYVFTEYELEIEEQKLFDFMQNKKSILNSEIIEISNKIHELTNKLSNVNDDDNNNDYSHDNKVVNKCKDEMSVKSLKDSIQNDINQHNLKLKELQSVKIDEEELKKQARQFIIDEQLNKFKTNFIIENTPLGNVLMFYNHEKLTFDYYSDVTIPYRFLETVARKYVITYNYRPLYIDMDEELKNYEKKMEEDEKEKENKIVQNENENDKDKDKDKDNVTNEKDNKKKNVFAKFKSYNKDAGTGKVNTAPPPKNSIPQNRMSTNLNEPKKDKDGKPERFLLKERSNRYSYQGKLANFNILQKIDRKKVDKKYAMTFSDFKKLKLNNKI